MKPIRVLCGHGYAQKFIIQLGQRNADMVPIRRDTLGRFFRWGEALSIAGFMGGDVVHAFNRVVVHSKVPWFTSFESRMPRLAPGAYPRLRDYLVGQLLSPQCHGAFAFSKWAKGMTAETHKDAARLSELLEKIQVRYPSVPITAPAPKERNGALKLLFVSQDFFGKMGMAVVRAHTELRATGANVETTLITRVKDHTETPFMPPGLDLEGARSALRETPGITWHESLPNDQVRKLMLDSDVLVHPTIHDSFGYVLIEALGAGMPLVGTAICAIPEMIDEGANGYLLRVPTTSAGAFDNPYFKQPTSYLELYRRTEDDLTRQMVEKIGAIEGTAGELRRMSGHAIEIARERFDAERARDEWEQRYADAARRPRA